MTERFYEEGQPRGGRPVGRGGRKRHRLADLFLERPPLGAALVFSHRSASFLLENRGPGLGGPRPRMSVAATNAFLFSQVIARELAEYAEAPSAYSVWPPGFTRILNERYCLVLGPHAILLRSAAPAARRRRRRDGCRGARARGRKWSQPPHLVGRDSATPDDLAERLEELGLEEPDNRVGSLVALRSRAEAGASPARRRETVGIRHSAASEPGRHSRRATHLDACWWSDLLATTAGK